MTPTIFTDFLVDAATAALPFIAGGIGAGAVIFTLWLGIGRAFAFFSILADMNSHSPGGNVGSAWSQSGQR